MSKQKLWKRAMAVILTMVLTVTLIPAFCETPVQAAEKTVQLGAEVLENGVNTESAAAVYYGKQGQYKWRVIGYNGNVANNPLSIPGKITLIADGNPAHSYYKNNGYSNEYSGSDLKNAIEAIANNLSSAEKANITKRDLTGGSGLYGEEGYNNDHISGVTVNDAVLWPLSVNEANSLDNELRKADPAHPMWLSSYWWLRSPGRYSNDTAWVYGDGYVYERGDDVNKELGVRPAFYLNLSSIIFTSLINPATADTPAEYKLTVKDDSINTEIGIDGVTRIGNTITVPVSVTSGTYNRVSVVMTDGTWTDNGWSDGASLKYYGKLDAANSFVLPNDYNISWNTYILAEQVNGEKETDYASAPSQITVPGWEKTADTLMLGTTGIGNPDSPTSLSDAWKGSYVYYGTYDGRYGTSGAGDKVPVKYRVLQNGTTDFSEEAADGSKACTMLLDCDNVLYNQEFDDNNTANSGATYPNQWYYSDIAGHAARDNGGVHNSTPGLNDADIGFIATSFTETENAAIAYSTIGSHLLSTEDSEAVVPVEDWTKGAYVNYVALYHEKLFLLDGEDASNFAFGYIKSDRDNACRVKHYIPTESSGNAVGWWLRSAYDNDYSAGCVCSDGFLYDLDVTYSGVGVSPAFNINLSSVIFSSLINGTEAGRDAEYKLTVKDAGLNIAVTEGVSVTIDDTTKVVTVPYTVTDTSDTSTPDQVSVVITDKEWTENGWSDGASLLQYGKLTVTGTQTTGNVTTGTGAFTLDTTKVNGTWGTNYHVYILAEDVSTDDPATGTIDESKLLTDYASTPREIHVHSFTYAAGTGNSADTITATCTNGGCGLAENKVSFSIVAPQLNTYGGTESAVASLSGEDAFNSTTGNNVSVTDIKYTGINGTNYPESSTPTVSAGEYRTSITVDTDKTAYVDYTIAKRNVTVTAKDQTVNEGANISTGTDYITASEGVTGLLTGHYISAITLTKDEDNGLIIPSIAEIKDAAGNTVTGNYNISYVNGVLNVNAAISATVTFKVVNGSWGNETDPDKVNEDIIITLTGYEGDTLKLTDGQIPAAGSKPDDTYKAGSWDTVPGTETAITADTIYTYTYAKKDSISKKVTFKVINGAWDNETDPDKIKEDIIITLNGYEGDILKLTDGQIPAVGNKPNDTYKAGSWDITPSTETVITADTTYTYTYINKDSISAKVTFKVVNGSWDDGTTADKLVTLTGHEGDILKLAEGQIPSVGNKPDETYKAGSWDVTPNVDAAITTDTTYTYKYAKKDSISAKVTFKVVNGAWDDGKTENVIITLGGYDGDTLKLANNQIPAVGSKPGDTYKAGSWDVTPGTDTTFADGSTTIYTYTYAKEELTPGPSLSPEPSLSPAPSPAETPAVTTNTTPTPTPTPLPYTSDETKTFSDGSKMLTTKTWNEDGTYTEKSVREWKNGNKTTKEFIQDLKTEKVLYSFDESITFSKLGNETIKTAVSKVDGYRFNSTEKIFTSGTTKLSSTEILADKTRQEIKETRTAEGSLSRKVMDTDPEGASKLTVTVETPADKPDGTNEAVNRTVTIYNVGKDKTAELVSLKTDSESVTIPKSVYFGGTYYKVFSISDKAFRNNKTVTVVVIGKNVKTIGEKAFYGCTNLENIYVYSKQIESVGKKAFYKISKKAVFHIKAKKKICSNLARMIKDAGYKGNVKYEKIK